MESKNTEQLLEIADVPLHVKLELPEGEKAPGTVALILHGFTGHMEEPHIFAAAEAARAAGCIALRAELYGHGKSGGTFRDHTIPCWVDEIDALSAWAAALPGVKRVVLCGHSQGGLAVMLSAARRAGETAGLALLSPAMMIPEGARRGELLGQRFDPSRVPDEFPTWEGLTLRGAYLRTAQGLDPFSAAAAYRDPVLLVQGTEDEVVPRRCAEELAERYADCRLEWLPGANHCYDGHVAEYAAILRAWFGVLA